MPGKKLSADAVRQIIELKSRGELTFEEISEQVGCGLTAAKKHWRAHLEHRTDVDLSPSPVGDDDEEIVVDEILNALDDTGIASLTTKDGFIDPAEFAKICNLGPEWIATHYKPNRWQSFIKVLDKDRPEGFKAEKVDLFQSKVMFQRAISKLLGDALIRWARDNIEPLPAPPAALFGSDLDYDRISQEPEQVATVGLYDLHMGMYAYGAECGEDWDVEKALNRAKNAVDDAVDELRRYNITRLIGPMGNDLMHYDNVRYNTAHGDHALDHDSRFQRVHDACVELLGYWITRMLQLPSRPVFDGFYLPGNHDTGNSYGICSAIHQRFRRWDNVKIDLSPSPAKFRFHEGVALWFDHGKDIPIQRAPLIFHERAQRAHPQGRANFTYKELQVGHTHQKTEKLIVGENSLNGLYVVVNPTLCVPDFYHSSKGWDGEPMKSMEVRRYSGVGVVGTHRIWACDSERERVELGK